MRAMSERKSSGKGDTQLDRFKEAARALECDDDPKAFEKRVGKIARAKPKAEEKK